MNSLNIPTHNRKYQIRVMEHVQKISVDIREVNESLVNAFTYLSQRLKIYPCLAVCESVTHVNSKVISLEHYYVITLPSPPVYVLHCAVIRCSSRY